MLEIPNTFIFFYLKLFTYGIYGKKCNLTSYESKKGTIAVGQLLPHYFFRHVPFLSAR